MKKFISAVTAFAMAAGMMTGMTVVHAEAQITDEAGLKAAFEFGGEFVLANDITVSSILTPAKSLTLNLDNHKIDLGANYINLSNAGDYKFKNGTITSTITGKTRGTISIKDTSTTIKPSLELSGVTVSADDVALYMNTPGTVTIKDNSHIKNTKGTGAYGVILANNGTVNMTDSNITYKAESGQTFSAIRSESNYPVLNLTNVIVNRTSGDQQGRFVTVLAASSATMTIEGGTYTGNNQCIYWAGKGSLNILEGNFSAVISAAGVFDTNCKNITITGGTFGADPSAFVLDNETYEIISNANGTWTVKEKQEEPTEQPMPTVSDVTEAEGGIANDGGITTKVFRFNITANDSTYHQVTVKVGDKSQSKTTPEITGTGNAVFAVVFVGRAETAFPSIDQISVYVE